MILPIGHEESGVRRLPWISFAVMALCFLTFLLVRPSASPEAGDRTHAEAILAEVSGAAPPRCA